MDREKLILSASRLPHVSSDACNEYTKHIDALVAKMNLYMLQREDIVSLVGENNLSMMKDNHENHARFISSILSNPNPEVLVETILWVFRAYRSHGFTTNYWAAQLNGWIQLLKSELSPDSYVEVYAYYEWMQVNIPMFVVVSDSDLTVHNSMH